VTSIDRRRANEERELVTGDKNMYSACRARGNVPGMLEGLRAEQGRPPQDVALKKRRKGLLKMEGPYGTQKKATMSRAPRRGGKGRKVPLRFTEKGKKKAWTLEKKDPKREGV